MTNGDKVRVMTDEQLAYVLMCPNEAGMADIPCDQSDDCDCCACICAWLEEEDDTDAE